MKAESLKILILKSLAINMPILRQLGLVFPRVIHIVVERGKISSTIDGLKIFENCLEYGRNSDFDFHIFATGKKNSEAITTLALSAQTDSSGNTGLPIVISDSPIIEDEYFERFYIFLNVEKLGIPLTRLVPDAKEIALIKGLIKNVNKDNEDLSVEQQVLNAAACFLKPYILKYEPDFTFAELLDVAGKMCDDDEMVRMTNDLKSNYKHALYLWRDNCPKLRCIDITCCHENNITNEDLLTAFVFDEDYLYIKESLFKEVVRFLKEDMPINIIKSKLRDEGILVTDNSKVANYVVKVKIPTTGDEFINPRMMRFVLEELDYPGELSFKDQCLMGGI